MSINPSDDVQYLHDLIGLELSAVVFVRDYVQLQFDGPILTINSDPEIEATNGVRIKWGELGFRDQLCAEISRCVVDVSAIGVDVMNILFDSQTSLLVPLVRNDYLPEAVILQSAEGLVVI